MNDTARRRFLEDLENMDPDYVEKKLLIGDYVGWRETVARGWIERRNAKRRSLHTWLSAAMGLGMLVATAVTAVAAFMPK
jgi:hypothetical protein